MSKPLRWEALGGGYALLCGGDFAFGTDALLLADFALREAPRAARCADLGAGSGVIAMLLARGAPAAQIDAVELLPQACELLEQSVRRGGLQERLHIINGDLRALAGVLPAGRYDLVCCNPPYFKPGAGLASAGAARRTARQEDACTFEEIACSAARLLRHGGRFCVCQRPQRLCTVITGLRQARMEPKTLQFVQKDAQTPPKLFLLCARKGGGEGLQVLPPRLLSSTQRLYGDSPVNT